MVQIVINTGHCLPKPQALVREYVSAMLLSDLVNLDGVLSLEITETVGS